MPYRTVAELPTPQTDQYSAAGKAAFLAAFNRSARAGHAESLSFAIAHGAAKRADRIRPARATPAAPPRSPLQLAPVRSPRHPRS